ncbi:MAG: hypothetical protein WCR48_02385 [Bacteroidales bacterium]
MFKSLDVKNENQPNIENLATASDFYALLTNGYNTWYNGSIAASSTMAFACDELFSAGTNSWGSGMVWFQPRRTLFNDEASDPVIIINFGAWYNYYGSVGMAVKMARMFQNPDFSIKSGGVDYTTRARAHAYIIEALLYGNVALLYDKAYLYTDDSGDINNFDFVANTKDYHEVMDYAISKLNQAIDLIKNDEVDSDPSSVIAGVVFTKTLLLQFANSIGARFLASNARTQDENAKTDWSKVKTYAENGLTEDFAVEYADGWKGKVMTRDYGMNYFVLYNYNWIRAGQWLLHKMAPEDSASEYPIPVTEGSDSYKDWPAIKNCPDARLNKYFKFESMRNWFGADRISRAGYGTYILSQYRYWRYYDVVNSDAGYVDHYLKAENDTYLAEALIHLNGSKEQIAKLINNSRVTLGKLTPLTGTETYDKLEEALFYERYVECDMVWPQLGFYDRRRNKDQMMEGTVRHFPIPAPELNLHSQPIYTFGGVENEM